MALTLATVHDGALVLLVLLAAGVDLAWRVIPNRLVLTGLVLAPLLQASIGGAVPLAALAGALCGLLLFLPLYLLRGMAAGDVKLMAMVGAFTGPALALQVGAVTLLLGGVMALVIVLLRRNWRQAGRNIGQLLYPLLLRVAGVPLQPRTLGPGASVGGMPYGVAIAGGTLLVLARRDGWL
jgi:prepilin peptidase CpaA